MSEQGLDGELLLAARDAGIEVQQSDERLVELSNGCICCTLREDLLEEVGRIADDGGYDALVIESTGISEPLPVAQTLSLELEELPSVSDRVAVDAMITVVDAARFPRTWAPTTTSSSAAGRTTPRTLARWRSSWPSRWSSPRSS